MKEKIIYIISILTMTLLLSGCGEPLPEDKNNYEGFWESKEMTLLILRDGSVDYERLKRGATVSVAGPIKEFQGNDFIVGIAFLKTTFVVSKPPYQEGNDWKMIVDGVELTKNDT
ncbi:MAG: hypothetical protein OCC45_10750 [Desulfotalea sp.]